MRKYILIITVVLSSSTIYGQISTEVSPISFGRRVSALNINGITQKILPSLDMNTIEREDREDETNGIPPRFGFPHKVNYNLNKKGGKQ